MSTTEILAGKAYAELSLRDRMTEQLKSAQARLFSFAVRANAFGQRLMTGAGIVGGGILAAITSFTAVGAQLQDMSNQSGLAASSLSALSYAAKLTGTDVEAVGKSATALSKFTLQLAQGNKKAAETLKLLNINQKEFLAASPEAKFAMIADAVSKIHDPLIRNGLAMKILGKGAKDLMPMLAQGSKGLMALFKEGRENGAILSDDDIAKAAELDDAWDRLTATGQGLINTIAIPLAEAMAGIVNWITKGVASFSAFLRANQGLVVGGAIAVAGLFALGGVIVAIAGAAWMLGSVIGAVTTIIANWAGIMAAGGAVIAFILNPITLLVAGIVGLVALLVVSAAMWMRYTKSGQEAFAALSFYIAEWKDTTLMTIAGVTDAIASNNWERAAAVASAGLTAGFNLSGLKLIWDSLINYFWQSWYSFVQIFADIAGSIGLPWAEELAEISANAATQLEQLQHDFEPQNARAKALAEYTKAKADLQKEREKDRRDREKLDKEAAEKAKRERERIEKAWNDRWKKTMSGFGGLGVADPAKAEVGGHFSTFSGTAANLAAISKPESAHERTAKATEAALPKLDDIIKKLDEDTGDTYDE